MFSTRGIVITLIFGLMIVFSGTAFAQQTTANPNATTPSQTNQPMGRRMRRHGAMGMGGVRQLNLTEQQRTQLRSIIQSQFQSTQSQRQELRQLMEKSRTGTLTDTETARAQELRQQLRQSRQSVHTQMMALLTPEQKAQLESAIQNRRENRGKFGPRKPRIS